MATADPGANDTAQYHGADPRWQAIPPLLIGGALLLWPSAWNGYPIVFADTGTYLSQAIHRYLGWDRPIFYSLFIFPLHATVSTWPVPIAQALIAAWLLHLTRRVIAPHWSRWSDPAIAAALAIGTWLPFLASTLMPDLFTPLLVLALCLLAFAPARLAGWERWALAGLATFMIAAQQSSVILYAALAASAGVLRRAVRLPDNRPAMRLLAAPLGVAALGLASVNLIGHGRFSLSPYGDVFLLARVIYDGPGRSALQRECPQAGWRLCDYLQHLPPTSDEFLWRADSPVMRAGGHKAVSAEARPIILAALRAEPLAELRAVAGNAAEQLVCFASGDGLEPWPMQVSPWIARDFPPAEQQSYLAARQQRGDLAVPPWLATLHAGVALAGVAACLILLPIAVHRRGITAGFLAIALLTLPVSALITGGLSTPHDRYQARVMWLPPFVAALAFAAPGRAGRTAA